MAARSGWAPSFTAVPGSEVQHAWPATLWRSSYADIIVTPNPGVIYTGSSKKQEEHGGFSYDDTNTILLLANPGFKARTVYSAVENTQIAPTTLKALGLNPRELQGVQVEGTGVLPDVRFEQ